MIRASNLIGIAILLPLLACPTASEPLTSVDGLAGGDLTTAVSAPGVTAASISFTEANGQTVAADEIATTTLAVSQMTVTGGLARPGETLINVLGFPIGTVTQDVARGYAGVNARCAAQFPSAEDTPSAAHMCSQQEVFLAVQANPAAIPDDVVGAAYSTFSFGSPFDLGDPNGKELIDDCDAWRTRPSPFIGTPDVATGRAAVLAKDPTFGFYPSIASCGDALPLACCR